MKSKNICRRVLLTIISFALLAGLVEIAIHHYDPTRVVYRRLKAPDSYLYEKIDPKLLKTDVVNLIHPDVIRNPDGTRTKLIHMIWGPNGYPAHLTPTKIEVDIKDGFLGELPVGTKVSKLYFNPGLGLSSWPYLATSSNSKNRLVIYHHGFGDPIDRMSEFLSVLLEDGYDVLALNALGHGGTLAFVDSDQDGVLPGARQAGKLNIFHQMSHFERPLKYHLDPIIGALVYARHAKNYDTVDMVGFSMGGFLTMLSAAVILEIERSYPVAGVYPNFMRRGQEILHDSPPSYPPLMNIANHLELFILGASGANRSQVQFFNRYDRCCFNGIRSNLYKAEVQDAVRKYGDGGQFDIRIDESHADHRISRFTTNAILQDLNRDR
ncbi:MAG: alpha/beta fold hydrolase [Alphaproteobacteria bacterium]|nr:alpha/beta fold hydrolase [Alphaproteobacteria bacterium]